MAKKVVFSNNHLNIDYITTYRNDVAASLRNYFSLHSVDQERFLGYSTEEISSDLRDRIQELDYMSSLSLLAALEAFFRIDYLQRNYRKKKYAVSRALLDIYKSKNDRASLEDDILEAWLANTHNTSQIIGELKGAFKYRHWLAHGRYWNPKMGRKIYDYDTIYQISRTVVNSFPFEGINPRNPPRYGADELPRW